MVSGVIKGSVVGPLTFLVFINELIEILDSYRIKVKFFVDDTKLGLYVKIVNSVDTAVLQAALNALCLWADNWQLTVAIDKCCVLHIGKADKTPTVYLINNAALPAVLSCRDLGITITHDLSPSMHITDIVAKAHKGGNAILRCFMSRDVDMLTSLVLNYVAYALI